MIRPALLLLILCVVDVKKVVAFFKANDKTLLISYPMIMSHDAATGELEENRDHIVADWAKTQSVGLVAQLDCGSRSFDYRPYYKDGVLTAHHGGVKIHKTMESSVLEILQWSNSNPKDLIILYVSHFDGDDGAQDASVALLKKLNIHTITACSDLKSLTYGAAKRLSTHATGGNLLAVIDCTDEYYDDKINCSGKGFVCYDEDNSDKPWAKFNDYIQTTTNHDPTQNSSLLWMTQAHWQSNAGSVVVGTLHRSSLLLDESRSQVNVAIEKTILSGGIQYLNFLELDNVCDNGVNVYNAIQKTYIE